MNCRNPTNCCTRTIRWAVRGSLLAIIAAGLALIAAVPPTPQSWYPKCTLYMATGLHCPGCGSCRAIHELLNGRIVSAASQNLLVILALPIGAVFAIRSVLGRGLSSRPAPVWSIALMFLAILVFGVLRNIPVQPFARLAPHELTSSGQ